MTNKATQTDNIGYANPIYGEILATDSKNNRNAKMIELEHALNHDQTYDRLMNNYVYDLEVIDYEEIHI